MVSKCHAAGVGVIAGAYLTRHSVLQSELFADTIFNHMAGPESGVGVAGSSFTHYAYPGIYQYQVSMNVHAQPCLFPEFTFSARISTIAALHQTTLS